MTSRDEYERQLTEAQQHVEEGLRHIETQRAVIERRERDGHDIEESNDLLAKLVDAQNLHEQNLQRVLSELRKLP